MKNSLIYILSALTIILTILPCADGWSDHIHADHKYYKQGSPTIIEDLAEDGYMHFDLCSPFCACGCCGITLSSSIFTLQFEPLIFPNTPSILNSTAQKSLVDSFLFDLLDPPKYA